MGKLYAVKMKIHNAPGSVGFHSIWSNKADAERQVEARNRHNKDFAEYFLEEVSDYEVLKTYGTRTQVRVSGMAGAMELK